MMSKKERILNVIKDIRKFRFCGPSDDPDEQTAVRVGYHYGVTQLKHMVAPFIPESIGNSLRSIEVDMNDLYSVYEARAMIDALLPDIEQIIQGLDESVFDIESNVVNQNVGFIKEFISLLEKTGLERDKEIVSILLSMPVNEQIYILRYHLFLLAQTYYSLVETVATAPVGWMDYKLNHYYNLIVKGIQKFLDMPEFKDLSVEFHPPANLFPGNDLDIVWDCGISREIQEFVGHTQSFLNELNLLEVYNSDNIKKVVSYLIENTKPSLQAAKEYSQRAERGFNVMLDKVKKEVGTQSVSGQQAKQTSMEREDVKLKTTHKALIKALSKALEKENITEITRDALVRNTNYAVGSGNINQAYIELKKWEIITQDGQNFTPHYQHYKQNPPD